MKAIDIKNNYMVLLQLADKRLPVKLAFAISRNLTKLAPEVEMIEKQREKLCEEFAESKDGKPVMIESVIDGQKMSGYKIAEERSEDFQAQIKDLFDTEVAVDIMTVDPAVLDLLDSDRYDPLTPAQLAGIEWMIENA